MKNKYVMPAEWEKHAGTWLAWPHNKKHWPGKFSPIPKTYIEIVKALTPNERVFIYGKDEKMKQEIAALLAKNNALENVTVYVIPNNASWSRDHGPIFVKDEEGKSVILDWDYNANGNKWGPCGLDDKVPEKISELIDMPLAKPGIILEGGSIDVNGRGSLLTTKSCLLNKNRNPQLTQEEIEDYLEKYLGAENILWLKDGVKGDDTDGHIDDLARFVSEDTIVYAQENNTEDENYQILRENYELLKEMKTENGKAVRLIPLPMPEALYYKNNRLPASYCNFYIANNAVLVPTFGKPQDEIALNTLSKVFKGRKIFGINCVDLVWGFGTIHCSTQQQPE